MTPEPITTDLDHSKLLKEAGWEQGHAFFRWWEELELNKPRSYRLGTDDLVEWGYSRDEGFDAPSAEEILLRLPIQILHSPKSFHFTIVRRIKDKAWVLWYESPSGRMMYKSGQTDASLANAAAAMWCYLKKNNLLSA